MLFSPVPESMYLLRFEIPRERASLLHPGTWTAAREFARERVPEFLAEHAERLSAAPAPSSSLPKRSPEGFTISDDRAAGVLDRGPHGLLLTPGSESDAEALAAALAEAAPAELPRFIELTRPDGRTRLLHSAEADPRPAAPASDPLALVRIDLTGKGGGSGGDSGADTGGRGSAAEGDGAPTEDLLAAQSEARLSGRARAYRLAAAVEPDPERLRFLDHRGLLVVTDAAGVFDRLLAAADDERACCGVLVARPDLPPGHLFGALRSLASSARRLRGGWTVDWQVLSRRHHADPIEDRFLRAGYAVAAEAGLTRTALSARPYSLSAEGRPSLPALLKDRDELLPRWAELRAAAVDLAAALHAGPGAARHRWRELRNGGALHGAENLLRPWRGGIKGSAVSSLPDLMDLLDLGPAAGGPAADAPGEDAA